MFIFSLDLPVTTCSPPSSHIEHFNKESPLEFFVMVSPASSLQSLPEVNANGNESNKLPVRPAPKLFGSNDGASSGAGTPIGFQRHPHNKILDGVAGANTRLPSPQPTHLAIPGSPHRVLSEEDPGYIAAKFEGKEHQMEQGEFGSRIHSRYLDLDPFC